MGRGLLGSGPLLLSAADAGWPVIDASQRPPDVVSGSTASTQSHVRNRLGGGSGSGKGALRAPPPNGVQATHISHQPAAPAPPESGLGIAHSLTKKAVLAYNNCIEHGEVPPPKAVIPLQIEAFRHHLPSDVQAVQAVMPGLEAAAATASSQVPGTASR